MGGKKDTLSFFFFKQKTAYEIKECDWSSDVCSSDRWKIVVEKYYKHKGYYFMAEEDGRILGVLPLVYLKPPFIPGQLVSLPFCDLGGMLTEGEQSKNELVLEALALARSLKVKSVELRTRHALSPLKDFQLPFTTESHKVRMLLDLPGSSEELWNSLKTKRRTRIRRAEKNNLSFRWSTIEEIDSYYSVFCENMRDLGSPVHSKEWFRAILENYGENIRMGIVYCEEKPVSVGIILSTAKKICNPWASTLRNYHRLVPNMFLYWNFLKYASDNGYDQFDFGRSNPNEGTYNFKAQWGSLPEPLHWHCIRINGKEKDRKSTRLNSSHIPLSRMPSSA